ncbi:MAG: hypothetical protein V7K54_03245 [Nostoc sp.]
MGSHCGERVSRLVLCASPLLTLGEASAKGEATAVKWRGNPQDRAASPKSKIVRWFLSEVEGLSERKSVSKTGLTQKLLTLLNLSNRQDAKSAENS